MARAKKEKPPPPSDDEIRQVILEYFQHKNVTAISRQGKKRGSYVKESILKKELKESHGYKAQQVVSNLHYLLSMDWVEERRLETRYRTPSGVLNISTSIDYAITAAGVDKLMGPSKFTRNRFEGIKIEATGQNIITLGDGNQINAKFQQIGEELSELKKAVRESQMDDTDKVNVVMDIETIEAQLAKPEPNRGIIRTLWTGITHIITAAGLVEYATRITPYIQKLIS